MKGFTLAALNSDCLGVTLVTGMILNDKILRFFDANNWNI